MQIKERNSLLNIQRDHSVMGMIPLLCFFTATVVFGGLMICGCSEKSEDTVLLDVTTQEYSQENVSAGEYKELYGVSKADEPVNLYEQNELIYPDNNQMEIYNESETNKICFVHVCGAVNNPDVYELSWESRVVDAVRAAGGFTDDADSDYLNLAENVSDGMRIYVPTFKEVEELKDKNAGTEQINQIGVSVQDKKMQGESESQQNILVNINTADEATLMTLPGIGQSKATKIIAYREKNGAFNSISDIMNVDGIKNGMYDKIKELITVK